MYRARYVPRNIELAVKMVPDDVSDGTTLARFEREMEVLKELKHPNIVRTFGGVCEDKQRFYAMELIPGGTLEDRLKAKGRLPWEEVIDYGLQMCAALAFLHSKGVVHRDVKPSNFLVTADGRVKLSDFGLASVMAARKITAEGRTAGTFLYMAPEQIRGQTVTAATDLYALGCVFFELLTGRPPLVGDTPAETLHKHCKTPPPRVAEFAMDCPVSLERVVGRLLEKEAEKRYQSAEEVAAELQKVSQSVEIVEPRGKALHGPVGNVPVQAREPKQKQSPPTEQAPRPLAAVPDWRKKAEIAGAAALAVLLIWNLFLQSGRSGGVEARRLWIEAASSPQFQVRIAAVTALGKIGDEKSLDVVARKLEEDQQPEVRAASAAALGDAGEAARSYVPKLIRARQSDERQEVRMAAETARKQLEN